MINRRKAIANGFSVDAILALPEMGCPDCLSMEVPYYYAGQIACIRQEHGDTCPRWKVASENDRIDPEASYVLEDGAVWTGEDVIKARMADPYLFLKQGATR